MSPPLLRANDVRIGGIYPLRLWRSLDAADPLFKDRTPAAKEEARLQELRRTLFAPDLAWVDRRQVLDFSGRVRTLTLSTGRQFRDLPLFGFVSFYTPGLGSVIFWIDFDETELEGPEMVEIAALVRGTPERIREGAPVELEFTFGVGTAEARSVPAFWDFLAARGGGPDDSDLAERPGTRFVHPLIYLGNVLDGGTLEAIAKRHQASFAALCNLWTVDRDFLKTKEIEEILGPEFHPFTYGLTFPCVIATVEAHTRASIAERQGVAPGDTTPEAREKILNHHATELGFMLCIVEFPFTEYFAYRCFGEQLRERLALTRLPEQGGLSPWRVWELFPQLVRALNLQRRVEADVSLLRQTQLTRARFTRKAIQLYQELLSTDELAAGLTQKLSILNQTVNAYLTVLLAVLGFVVAALGIALTIVQLVAALGKG